jgi:ElaB/YqjD/DUF883 family membrane-anchored ribosome-binding protein
MTATISSPPTGQSTESASGNGQHFQTGAQERSKASSMMLHADLNRMKAELDALMGRAESLTDADLDQAYQDLILKFSTLRHAARGVANQARRKLVRSVDRSSDYVRDKPMQSMMVAAGVGMLLGILIGRR